MKRETERRGSVRWSASSASLRRSAETRLASSAAMKAPALLPT